jgi:hypothetical protein
MRLWHLLVVPRMAAALALPALALLSTPHWEWPLMALLAFLGPALVVLGAAGASEGARPWWRSGLAAARLVALTWMALLPLAPLRPLPPERPA